MKNRPFKNKFFAVIAVVSVFFALSFSACNNQKSENKSNKTPKYIFLFIGDGMGISHIQLTEAALPHIGHKYGGVESLNLTKLPQTGSSTTYAATRYITGSAAAGTALATGHKTSINTIAKNVDRTQNLESIAKMAKKKNMRVGIISSVSIDHATPAVFYANADLRSHYNYIASQMPKSGFDFFGGGYAAGNFEHNKTEKRNPDNYQAQDIEKLMEENGYQISRNNSQFEQLQAGKNWVFSSYESDGALAYEIDRKADELPLAQYTQKAIELLDNENGFFIMTEGGKIDWASHANDAATVAAEVIAFDRAVGTAIEFYKKHPDETLIIVTSDHETGGLGLGFSGTKYSSHYKLLGGQKLSSEKFSNKVENWLTDKISFESLLDSVSFYYGLNDTINYESQAMLSKEEVSRLKSAYDLAISPKEKTAEDYIIYGNYNPIAITVTRIHNQKAGIAWTTFSHTAQPVPVFALGVEQEEFTGYYDNTDIPKKIMKIGKLVVGN